MNNIEIASHVEIGQVLPGLTWIGISSARGKKKKLNRNIFTPCGKKTLEVSLFQQNVFVISKLRLAHHSQQQ